MRSLILPPSVSKDPPGLDRRRAPAIFDSRPHRNVGMPSIDRELSWLPDDELIATLVAHGQPRFSAEQVRHHGPARFLAARFWCDVQEAAEGDKQAKERVDYCRWSWQEMRKMELISDRPEHTIGLFDR